MNSVIDYMQKLDADPVAKEWLEIERIESRHNETNVRAVIWRGLLACRRYDMPWFGERKAGGGR